MFVRRLVSGVRSSCDASETSRRWASTESSSAASIVLNATARRPSSSLRSVSTRRRRSCVAVMSSAASVSRRVGTSADCATPRPSRAARALPPRAMANRIQRSRSSTPSTSSSGRAICSAKPRAGRDGDDAEVRPRDGGVARRTARPAPAATATVRSSTGSSSVEAALPAACFRRRRRAGRSRPAHRAPAAECPGSLVRTVVARSPPPVREVTRRPRSRSSLRTTKYTTIDARMTAAATASAAESVSRARSVIARAARSRPREPCG